MTSDIAATLMEIGGHVCLLALAAVVGATAIFIPKGARDLARRYKLDGGAGMNHQEATHAKYVVSVMVVQRIGFYAVAAGALLYAAGIVVRALS